MRYIKRYDSPKWLLCLLWMLPSNLVEASVLVLNATELGRPSVDPYFDYEVVLRSDNHSNVCPETLVFRWDLPLDGVLSARLEHTTLCEDRKPSWLGIGFFDSLRNTIPIFDGILDQVNGQAVVGTLFFDNPVVFKYDLGITQVGNPHGKNNEQNGGVTLLPDVQQTLVYSIVEQRTVILSDGTEAIWTFLEFAKSMDEGQATGDTDNSEAILSEDRDNIFTYAIGPAGMETLGMHDQRGAFRLNFQGVKDATVAPTTTDTVVDAPFAIVNATAATAAIEPVPFVTAYSGFDYQVQLKDNLTFYWAEPDPEMGLFRARLEHKTYLWVEAPSWLSLGFHYQRPDNNDFALDRSTAIIGKVWDESNAPLVYNLGFFHDQPGVIQPLVQQSLIESSFLQFEDDAFITYTVLDFTMNLTSLGPKEPPISVIGENIFVWALGPPGANVLSMHMDSGAFSLDFSAAEQMGADALDEEEQEQQEEEEATAEDEGTSVVNGTVEVIASEDMLFDYQVQLEEDVLFRWVMPDSKVGVFTGRLIHTTSLVEETPTWLGFGVADRSEMHDIHAIIGRLPSEKVEKYALGANHTANGFLQVLPLDQQMLIGSRMIQLYDPETGVYTTELTFLKLLIEENPSEAPILLSGENLFVWAVGNPLSDSVELGMHRDYGFLSLDFSSVLATSAGATTAAPSVTEDSVELDGYPTPVIVGQCSSSLLASGNSILLTPDLTMHWVVNDAMATETARQGEASSVTVVLQYAGEAWLGLGFTDSSQAHSPTSTAVMGIPATSDEVQLKYNISTMSAKSIVPTEDQTLIEASINQEDGMTTLRFTKSLIDGPEEMEIEPEGLNYFSFAVGAGNQLGYHQHRGSFQMDVSDCYEPALETAEAKQKNGSERR